MSFLENASIRVKILSLIIPLCVVGIAAGGYMAARFKATDTSYSEFISGDAVASTYLARAGRNLVSLGFQAYRSVAYDGSNPEFNDIRTRYHDQKKRFFTRIQQAGDLAPNLQEKLEPIRADVETLVKQTDKAVELSEANRNEEATLLLQNVDTELLEIVDGLEAVLSAHMQVVSDESGVLKERTNNTITVSLLGIAILFLIGIITALFVASRGITTPIARLRERMGSLASGETNAAIDGLQRKDEVGQMAQAVQVFRENAIERIRLELETEANRSQTERERIERETQRANDAASVQFAVDNLAMGLSKLSDGDITYRIDQPFTPSLDAVRNDFNHSAEKLQDALVRVSQNARGIDAGANEIKSAADDLAKRTEQQAAAVEETAAALEEITTTVKDSTKRAQEAGQLVARAKAGAERSGDVVVRAVHAMVQIERSANEISNIIGVIDEIAFQTNLLALNAGVEAARAGDAGKGFAVVAQEVRELAQRSASAAKDIKGLITASNDQVREGVQLVGDTGKALETIVSEVQEINRHVAAIVESAQEQASGLQQINTAVNQMDQDTQKNAAMVEESTAASHSLAREVSSLNHLLAQFKLSQASVSPAREASGRELPVASPARALGRRIASAFSGNAAVDTSQDGWAEF